jgi:hypothetical protein
MRSDAQSCCEVAAHHAMTRNAKVAADDAMRTRRNPPPAMSDTMRDAKLLVQKLLLPVRCAMRTM